MAEKQYLDNLTALRGIAACLVVVFHSNAYAAPAFTTEETFFFRKLYLMVDLFFVLSGFLMCYIYQDSFARGVSWGWYRSFLSARFARIYPLHFITLGVCVIITLAFPIVGKEDFMPPIMHVIFQYKDLPANIFLLNACNAADFISWNLPSWSISAIWWAYVLFPLLLLGINKAGAVRGALIGALILIGYVGLAYFVAPKTLAAYDFVDPKTTLDLTWNFGVLRGILGFALGMLMYRVYHAGVLKKLFSSGWVLLVLTLIWGVIAHLGASDVAIVALFPLVVLNTAYGSPGMNRFLNMPILQRLGLWSYSIYLWHFVLWMIASTVECLLRTTPPATGDNTSILFGISDPRIVWPAYLLTSIGIGALSYEYLEKPSRSWLRYVLSPKKTKASEVF